MRAERDALRAALAQQVPAVPGWQPIETAPRGADNEFVGWDGETIDKTWHGWGDDLDPVYVRADWVSWEPTHWMPLPATPLPTPEKPA